MADPAKVLFRNASYDGQLMRTLAAAMAGLGQEIWSEVVYDWLRSALLPDLPR